MYTGNELNAIVLGFIILWLFGSLVQVIYRAPRWVMWTTIALCETFLVVMLGVN